MQSDVKLKPADGYDEDINENLFLTFALGEQVFGMDVGHVREIMGFQTITKTPDSIDDFRGVINLRGEVIPVLDLRVKFQMAEIKDDERTCIIIIQDNNRSAGVIVDRVREVVNISAEMIHSASDVMHGDIPPMTLGFGRVQEEIVNLLRVPVLLGHPLAA